MNRLLVAVFFIFFFCGCAKTFRSQRSLYTITDPSPRPDYMRMEYWAAHPWKKDLSDSLPSGLSVQDSAADVFFVHPTTYTRTREGWNADINDPTLNARTDHSTILYQASVFNRRCRVFAPRYRQAHISAFYIFDTASAAAFDSAYADVKAAFEVYLKNYHRARPLIIAGHSQGGRMALRLLQEFFDGKSLGQYLAGAYIIGWPVPLNALRNIPVCSAPGQAGCFSTWRTYRKGYIPEYIQKEDPPSHVTNPLTWTTTGEPAPKETNKGSVLRNFSRIYPATTGARVHKGVLWVDKPRFPWSFLLLTRDYHIGDINLFYLSLRENVSNRVGLYLALREK